MTTLYLGGIGLALSTVTGLSLSHSWAFAAQATIAGVPRQQPLGPDGTSVRLTARLHGLLGLVPLEASKQLRELGDKGEVVALQGPDGQVIAWVVLESLDEDWTWVLPTGEVVESKVSLSLKPERPQESAPPTPVAVSGSQRGEETTPTEPNLDRDPNSVPMSEILRQ